MKNFVANAFYYLMKINLRKTQIFVMNADKQVKT